MDVTASEIFHVFADCPATVKCLVVVCQLSGQLSVTSLLVVCEFFVEYLLVADIFQEVVC